jgi:hypothetical protein
VSAARWTFTRRTERHRGHDPVIDVLSIDAAASSRAKISSLATRSLLPVPVRGRTEQSLTRCRTRCVPHEIGRPRIPADRSAPIVLARPAQPDRETADRCEWG